MCRTVRQTNHSCGHRVLTSMGKSMFCLFYPHKAEDFHAVTTVYVDATYDYPCDECKVKMDAFAKGLKGAEKHQYVKNVYAKVQEAQSKINASRDIAAAEKSQRCELSAEKIAQLNENARAQVAYYVDGNRAQAPYRRAILLKTIVQMPEVIDRKSLVKLFGSHIMWTWKDGKPTARTGLYSNHRRVLISIARHAGLAKTLEEGLKESHPMVVKAVEVK
ncbi:hypothetical protein F4805DRAFT_82202 [Annulohypoxylon moriforme]|nr:hypothetical protein F4805DRAFT_82202 [Annulohypoxylon moriforme]